MAAELELSVQVSETSVDSIEDIVLNSTTQWMYCSPTAVVANGIDKLGVRRGNLEAGYNINLRSEERRVGKECS